MFLEVRKNPLVFVQDKSMDAQYLAPVTSNFRLNLGLIAEVSTYSIKEVKHKKLLDGQMLEVPVNAKVIHLEMSYTHATKWTPFVHRDGRQGQEGINERYGYKLVFFPEAHDEYLRLKNIIERHTLG